MSDSISTMSNKRQLLALASFSLGLAGLVGLVVSAYVKQSNYRCMKIAADDALRTGNADVDARDFYGKLLRVELIRDAKIRVAKVASAGADRDWGTADDCEYTAFDYNKSRIIGEWVGSKAVEAGKGLADGIIHGERF